METEKCIKLRRSARSYLKKEVDIDLVAEVIDAARYAPSSGNIQNWKFVLVKDEKTRNSIASICKDQAFVAKAPVIIVVYAEIKRIKILYGIRGEALYSIQNCAAAIQNMIIRAHDLGLATCWVGDFDEKKLNDVLGASGDIRPQAIITLGYASEHRPTKKQPLKNFIFFDKWGERDRRTEYWPLERGISKGLKKAKDFLLKFK